jgi:hypothetical protein
MHQYMRTAPAVSTGMFLGLILAILATTQTPSASAQDKDTPAKMTPAADVMKKLAKAGDKVTIKADDSGRIDIDLFIGEKKYPAMAQVGKGGSIQWSLEEFDNGGKKVTALVLRWDRPDRDNASLMFKKLAPPIEQMALTTATDQDYGANVYTGKDDGGDEPADGKVRNMWSSMGNYGEKAAGGPLFYVSPRYKDDLNTAEGTRGFFISAVPQPTTTAKVGIVLGLTTWKTSK